MFGLSPTLSLSLVSLDCCDLISSPSIRPGTTSFSADRVHYSIRLIGAGQRPLIMVQRKSRPTSAGFVYKFVGFIASYAIPVVGSFRNIVQPSLVKVCFFVRWLSGLRRASLSFINWNPVTGVSSKR